MKAVTRITILYFCTIIHCCKAIITIIHINIICYNTFNLTDYIPVRETDDVLVTNLKSHSSGTGHISVT